VALRIYWCVLFRQATTAIRGRTVFNEVTQFSCELDLGEGMEYTVRGAFFTGIRQAGGDESDAGEYRMDVYGAAGDDHAIMPGFTVAPGGAVHRPAESLADYGDDELISELARRLRGQV
jgi:hypothetical protein